jgi:RNA polymerase sigma factor (sigma-70 family)
LKDLFCEYYKTKDIKLRNQLVLKNKHLAYKIAHQVQSQSNYNFDDLKQEALLCLVKAVENYNPTVGAFSTYAHIRIKGHLYNVLRDKATLIKTPRKALDTVAKWKRTRLKLQVKGIPSTKEIERESGVSFEDYKRCSDVISGCKGIGILDTQLFSPISTIQKLMKQLIANYQGLTNLQKEAIGLFLQNKSIAQIAKQLSLKPDETRLLVINSCSLTDFTVN